VRHPRRNVSERAVRLHDGHQLDAAVLEPPLDQDGLAASGMKPVVDPSFNRVFVGSMSPFRAGAEQRAGSPCGGRSARPWCDGANVCQTAMDPGQCRLSNSRLSENIAGLRCNGLTCLGSKSLGAQGTRTHEELLSAGTNPTFQQCETLSGRLSWTGWIEQYASTGKPARTVRNSMKEQ
jgi:hypothetical protein